MIAQSEKDWNGLDSGEQSGKFQAKIISIHKKSLEYWGTEAECFGNWGLNDWLGAPWVGAGKFKGSKKTLDLHKIGWFSHCNRRNIWADQETCKEFNQFRTEIWRQSDRCKDC